MPGRIIGCFSCILCALPFFYLAWEGKQKNAAPLAFWSGDNTLRDKIKDIPAYNAEMSRLYRLYASSFVLSGIFCLIFPPVGIGMIVLNCTAGLYGLWRTYKQILNKGDSYAETREDHP